ncbi:MAG: hypothetical protein ACREDR_18575, partial [Blastocatellia bacterium]
MLLAYARLAGVYADALIDDNLDLPDKPPPRQNPPASRASPNPTRARPKPTTERRAPPVVTPSQALPSLSYLSASA